MKMIIRSRSIPYLTAAAIMILGCAPRVLAPVTILGESFPSPYHVDPLDNDVLIYSNPNIKVTTYSQFLIGPVKIVSNEPYAIQPEQEAVLTDSFRQKLTEVLQDGYRVVDKPGPGVLRIQIAIQDIQPAHVQLDEEKFIVLRLDTLLARVAMEMECRDSVSGERVLQLLNTLEDRRYFESEKKSRLLNVRDAFGIWAESLKKRFDQARSRTVGLPASNGPSQAGYDK